MSLFDELQQWEIITNPQKLWSTNRIRKEKAEEKKKKQEEERKELAKKMKEELSPEEYKKWKWKMWYQDNREHHIQKELERQKRIKQEEDALLEEIYKDVYDPIPEPIDYDKYYTEKFKSDDVVDGRYHFSRWSSRLKVIRRDKTPKYRRPFRVCDRSWMKRTYEHLADVEYRAYEYMKPHLEETRWCNMLMAKRQQPFKYPVWLTDWKLKELIEESDINHAHICNVTDWMRRDKYIPWMTYLGRNSFIFGDVVVTQTGHTFRISLENNLGWLTPDTVEEIHRLRMERRKKKAKEAPQIYIVNDAYLVRVNPNERESLYFIVPT